VYVSDFFIYWFPVETNDYCADLIYIAFYNINIVKQVETKKKIVKYTFFIIVGSLEQTNENEDTDGQLT